jgi:very-short-patch-repair endonuclease
VDFYCASLKLVIELDGDSHSDRERYDRERTAYLNDYGVRVVRYTNFDVLGNMDGLLADLRRCCASRLPPLPSPLPACGERE